MHIIYIYIIIANLIHRFWPDAAQCFKCPSNATALSCHCQEKRSPISTFRASLNNILQVFKESVKHKPNASLIWVSLGSAPPDGPYNFFRNDYMTTYFHWDILAELECYAATQVVKAGGNHLDLRPMLQSAKYTWWNDVAHFGKTVTKGKLNPLKHVTVVSLFNTICEDSKQ